MNDKSIKRTWIVGFYLVIALLYLCVNKTTVWASELQFTMNAEVLQVNEETYDIQVTVANMGNDWEGAVRVIIEEQYQMADAYDTMISLPQGSTKQFVVKIPRSCIEDTDGTVYISLWDKKNKKVAERELMYLLREDAGVISLGILSDDYDSLTYWDLGGQTFYYHNDEYPIKLEEVTADTIVAMLEDLEILMIDTYNTSILTDEQIKAIDEWIVNGGVLMVGTGSYASDTLSGLGDTLLGIESPGLYSNTEILQYFTREGIDLSKIPVAKLDDPNYMYVTQYMNDSLCRNYGSGAIGVSVYSYTELAKVDKLFYQGFTPEDYVYSVLDSITSHANARYDRNQNGYNYEISDRVYTMLSIIGKINSPLNFGILKVIIAIYVLIAGPVIYLILRAMKKREAYWIAVPAVALVGIIIVFFAGRGFEVVDTRVFSVTTENVDASDKSRSFLYCYDADHKEWSLKLKDGYDYIGAFSAYGSYYNGGEKDNYLYHVTKENDTLSFGIKPENNFADSYFCAGKSAGNNLSSGNIVCYGLAADWGGICGTVTNETNYDFRYYVVVVDDCLYMYENLPAGESHDLAKQTPYYINTSGNNQNRYYRDVLREEFQKDDNENADILAALGIGLTSAYPVDDLSKTVVVGVVDGWENIVNDECSEVSYGCLYTVQ